MTLEMLRPVVHLWQGIRRSLGFYKKPSMYTGAATGTVTANGGEGSDSIDCSSGDSFSTSFVEVDLLREDLNAARNYPDNSIRTAKYTWLTCLPLSLLYQFHKVSNIYFLIVMILSIIPGASPVNPYSTIVPLCIVLGAGMAKDLWEDGKRRESDRRANTTKAFVLRGADFVDVPAHSVHVGDVMLYRLGDEVLADVVLLNSSISGGVAYMETANLDGETNAKTRRAKPETIEILGTAEDIIENCLPDEEMRSHFIKHGTTVSWHGTVSLHGASHSASRTAGPAAASGEVPMMARGNIHEASLHEPYDSKLNVRGSEGHRGQSSRETQAAQITHARSCTSGVSELASADSRGFHGRQLTFDERFVVGREMPMPSDILELSRRYEKHMSTHHNHHHSGHSHSHSHVLWGPSDYMYPGCEMVKIPSANEMDKSRRSKNETAVIRAKEEIGGENSNSSTTTTTGTSETASKSSINSSSGVVLLGAPPCSELYSWIGQLRIRNHELIPLGVEQLLPRGCVLRNTEWILCAVMYTGRNTKMLLNLRPKPMKMSVIARRINILNCFLLIVHQSFLFLLCGLSVMWRNSHLDSPGGTKSGYSSWYIQWYLSRYSSGRFFGWRYFTNFVLLSYLIPLSLYVTLEFNKAIQMVLIAQDRRMASFDEFNGELRYSRPKTSELNCQLAHVQYIFTDKTGTLTENIMSYVGGCTATKNHNERERPGELGEEFLRLIQSAPRKSDVGNVPTTNSATNNSSDNNNNNNNAEGTSAATASASSEYAAKRRSRHTSHYDVHFDFEESLIESQPIFQYLRALSLCHSVVCFDRSSVEQIALMSSTGGILQKSLKMDMSSHCPKAMAPERRASESLHGEGRMQQAMDQLSPSGMNASSSVFHASTASGVGRFLHGHTGSLGWYVTRFNDMQTSQHSGTVSKIISGLRDDSKIYEGQSLDEIALVAAARDNLFALQRRSAKHIFIKVVNKVMCYEIIAELEFTPQRKLMSILLCRCPSRDNESMEEQNAFNCSYHRGNNVQEEELQESKEQDQQYRQSSFSTTQRPPREMLESLYKPDGIVNVIPLSELRTSAQKDSAAVMRSVHIDMKNTNAPAGAGAEEERPYLLLVKGADNSMMSILNKKNPRNKELKVNFQRELEIMAQQGLRTLVIGQRYLSEGEVRDWLPTFNEAQCSMQNRNEKLHIAYALIEKDIDLIGTTAVEDRLQEGVPETLTFLLQAEIVIWMLTGDKRETAVTIAGTSKLIDPEYRDCICHLDVAEASSEFRTVMEARMNEMVWQTLKEQMNHAIEKCDEYDQINEGRRTIVLVVDGRTLDIIFTDNACTHEFFKLGIRCRSAVCCRMTPLQKAKIVKLFQKNTNSVALAIGDGANDVSMIQESHIGVGIMGLEGSQAELASDYAIPKFRFLKRLLVVHGRFALYRDAHCIVFSLYKNVVLCTGLVTYAFFCGFSGMILVESWLLAMFNLFFCSLQPLALGIFDKDVDDELAESTPSLYPALSREQMFFSWPYILKWLLDGVVDGLILFFVIFYTVGKGDELYAYYSSSIEDYGVLFFMVMLLILNLRIAALMTCYTVISFSVIALGFAVIPLLTMAHSAIPNLLGSDWCVGIAMLLLGSNKFWLLALLGAGIYVVYGVTVNTYIALFWPWTNGGTAMRAAWRSPYRLEHKQRMERMRRKE